jgi:acyl carrier protein
LALDEDLTAIFREHFNDPTLELSDSMTAADIPGWDSLQHVTLVYLIEDRFGIEFIGDEAADLADVGALKAQLRAKGCV